MHDAGQLGEISRQLTQRAEELRRQIRGKLGEAADTAFATDHQWSDAGAAFAEAGVEYAEAQRDIVELRSILQALPRIEEGNYGICADCGADIPAARMIAQPAALTCIACQSARERRGQVSMTV
jgi:DnaK suppressor protein